MIPHPTSYVIDGHPNSGPCAYTASPLPTKPFLQPWQGVLIKLLMNLSVQKQKVTWKSHGSSTGRRRKGLSREQPCSAIRQFLGSLCPSSSLRTLLFYIVTSNFHGDGYPTSESSLSPSHSFTPFEHSCKKLVLVLWAHVYEYAWRPNIPGHRESMPE